jgi:Alginate lyase
MIKKNRLGAVLAVMSMLASPALASANTNLSAAVGPLKILSWTNVSFLGDQKAKALDALRVFFNGRIAFAETLARELLEHSQGNRLKASNEVEVVTQRSVCSSIVAPAVSLATSSKYEQDDVTRSELSGNTAEARNAILKPTRKSIADLSQIMTTDAEPSLQVENAKCFQINLVRWAEADALTQMDSIDAFLTRDRFISEITLNLIASQKIHPMNPVAREKISKWLASVAASTVEFYQYRAGNKVKINNHRYWAGLAVGSIGYVIASNEFKDWGARSYQVGVCQVDAAGYLPLELSRGDLALDYHIYALRPLQAFATLASAHGDNVDGKCGDGLKRLRDQTLASLSDATAISALTGLKQGVHAKEKSYSKPLQLASLGIN